MSERKVRLHGYYDDREKFARDAEEVPGQLLFHRQPNWTRPFRRPTELRRCKQGACTKAENIIRRTLLYVDCDAVKPAGTPSTDAQHEAAIDLARHIPAATRMVRCLARGFRQRSTVCSGRSTSRRTALCRSWCSEQSRRKWETPAVTIDTTVASVSRIGRLLGTHNYKGGHIGRQATIIDAPHGVVTEEILPPPGVTVTPELLAARKSL